MKKILIVGENSYIGRSFGTWVKDKDCSVEYVSSRNNVWKEKNFGEYDSIIHVAGIAHVDAKADMEALYYAVNRDLTIASCEKAKEDGARQFIFLSSIIVYGESHSLEPVCITKDTEPVPNGFYGQSKLDAEKGILPLSNDGFCVSVVRPPMVYGKDSKGNYPKLAKLAKKCPVFPDMLNQRSMIHIDNLCECIWRIVEDEYAGVVCPQNREYVSTTELVREIASQEGKKIHTTKLFNGILRLLAKKITLINKVFGSLVYDQAMSDCFEWEYCVCDFAETIRRTEGKE